MTQVPKESDSHIKVKFLIKKEKKNTDKINVALVEKQNDGCMVRGTCRRT